MSRETLSDFRDVTPARRSREPSTDKVKAILFGIVIGFLPAALGIAYKAGSYPDREEFKTLQGQVQAMQLQAVQTNGQLALLGAQLGFAQEQLRGLGGKVDNLKPSAEHDVDALGRRRRPR